MIYGVRMREGRAGQRVWVVVTVHDQREICNVEYVDQQPAEDMARALNVAQR